MSRRIVGSGLGGLHSDGAGLELDGIERIEVKNDHMPAIRPKKHCAASRLWKMSAARSDKVISRRA